MGQALSKEMFEAVAQVREVLETGPVVDRKSGRTTSMIAETAEMPIELVARVLKWMDQQHIVDREINGKRCYAVRLLTDAERLERSLRPRTHEAKVKRAVLPPRPAPAPLRAPEAVIAAREAHPSAGPLQRLPVLSIVTSIVDDYGEQIRAHVPPEIHPGPNVNHAELAAEILRQAIDAAAGPGRVAAELREVQVRLGEQTAESQRLRGKLRIAEDECKAARVEIDGLRRRAQQAEANLERVIRGGMLDVNRERELREIVTMMRPTVAAHRPRHDDEHAVGR